MAARLRRRLTRYAMVAAGALTVATAAVLTYGYYSYSQLIDARLHGEGERIPPRVYARPVEFRRGQAISEPELVARLLEGSRFRDRSTSDLLAGHVSWSEGD